MSTAVVAAMRKGASGGDYDWNALVSPRPQQSLHGLTGFMNFETPEWVIEVRRSGHMLAGVWSFAPAAHEGGDQLSIGDWYGEFFTQFFEVAANVAKAGSLAGEFLATATLVRADALRSFVQRG